MSTPADKPFTLAHLTDAHLPSHGEFALRELGPKRALSALNWARARRRQHLRAVADALRDDVLAHAPDHVAMTGDITNFGLPREFAAGADWLSGFGSPGDVSFTPGNHDAMVAGVEAERRAAFAPFTAGDDGALDWPWLRRRGPVALIGVSTAIPTPPGFARGEAGPAQIERLRAHLAATRGAARIVLIHHPPTDLSPPRKHLTDRAAIRRALTEEGAELVLHGHNHLSQLSSIDGRIPVLGAPAASTPAGSSRPPAEWRLITVTGAEGGFAFDILRRTVGRAATSGRRLFADRGRFRLTAKRIASESVSRSIWITR